MIERRKEPRYAAGQELTLHPGDPVRGAELLEDRPGEENGPQEKKAADRNPQRLF